MVRFSGSSHDGADRWVTLDDLANVARGQGVEHDRVDGVLHGQRQCWVVHEVHLGIRERGEVVDLVVLVGTGVGGGVGIVDSIHLGGLEHGAAFGLSCQLDGRLVGGCHRQSGPSAEDHDLAAIEASQAALEVVGLDVALDSRLQYHLAFRPATLDEGVSQKDAVHLGGAHSGLVCRDATSAMPGKAGSTHEVATTGNDQHLNTGVGDGVDDLGDHLFHQKLPVDAMLALASEHLARVLEHDTPIRPYYIQPGQAGVG